MVTLFLKTPSAALSKQETKVIQMLAVQVSIEMLSSDYVAELRAEVTVWWESLRAKPPTQSDGPIRIITQGQELVTEFDEKTLGEIGFKDSQVIWLAYLLPLHIGRWAHPYHQVGPRPHL